MTENDKLREELKERNSRKAPYECWNCGKIIVGDNMMSCPECVGKAIKKAREEKDKEIGKYKDDFIQTLEENGKLKQEIADLKAENERLKTGHDLIELFIKGTLPLSNRKFLVDVINNVRNNLLNEIENLFEIKISDLLSHKSDLTEYQGHELLAIQRFKRERFDKLRITKAKETYDKP